MKQMVVTGLSNEQDFETGESVFVLVLNREIRIPVSEETAALIIQKMYGGEKVAETESEQQEETNGHTMPNHGSWEGNNSQDEDGVDQI